MASSITGRLFDEAEESCRIAVVVELRVTIPTIPALLTPKRYQTPFLYHQNYFISTYQDIGKCSMHTTHIKIVNYCEKPQENQSKRNKGMALRISRFKVQIHAFVPVPCVHLAWDAAASSPCVWDADADDEFLTSILPHVQSYHVSVPTCRLFPPRIFSHGF
jgi:hypothetical protein